MHIIAVQMVISIFAAHTTRIRVTTTEWIELLQEAILVAIGVVVMVYFRLVAPSTLVITAPIEHHLAAPVPDAIKCIELGEYAQDHKYHILGRD